MSTLKTLILTRPEPSAAQILAQVQAALGGAVPVVLSPVLKIESEPGWPDMSDADVIIATSVNAIHGPLGGKPVFCVGARTADAAAKAGGEVRHCALDAASLIAWIGTQPNPGHVLYLRGSHVATDIPAALAGLNIDGRSVQTYRQEEQPLTETARHVIEGERPAILPLFSPRSARLVGQAVTQIGADLHVIAISDAVAKVWRAETGGASVVVAQPTGDAMLKRIVAALRH